MKRGARRAVLWLLLLTTVVVAVPQSRGQSRSALATRLRITEAITVAGEGFTASFGGFRCDTDGNVFFIPLSPVLSIQNPKPSKGPDTVVRVSGDGRRTTRFRMSSIPDLRDGSDWAISTTALDASGKLRVLVSDGHSQYIVAFYDDGKYKSRVEIPHDIDVRHFAVFESGEWLVSGFDEDRPRLAVASPDLGSLNDVRLPQDPARKLGLSAASTSQLIDFSHAEAGSGHVYFARNSPKGPVFEVLPNGEVSQTILLATPRRDATLSALKIARQRLAAVHTTKASDDSTRSWISVYDLSSGERLAVYGPIGSHLMCYQSAPGFPDRFTLLGVDKSGQMQLLRASPP